MFRTEQINEFYDEKSLEAFWAIVKTGRLTEAAAMLDVTQPAISAAIKKLELKLEKPLIQRGGYKKIVLTNEGKKLFLFAEKYFSSLTSNILYKSTVLSEEFKVGISSMLPKEKLQSVLSNIAMSNLYRSHLVSIMYEMEATSNIINGFENGKYDIIYIPDLGRDVCLSLNNDIHPLNIEETYRAYKIFCKTVMENTVEGDLGFIASANFSMINLLPKPLKSVVLYNRLDELYSNIVGQCGYIVLSESQVSDVLSYGLTLEELNESENETINFGFCFRPGAESLVQICNSRRDQSL